MRLDKKRNELEIMKVFILGAISFCFLFLLYNDQIVNSTYGYRYMDSILSGSFGEFFNDIDWSYGLSIYTIYAIWSLPVCLYSRIVGPSFNLQSIPVLIWYKILLALFALWSVYLLVRIVRMILPEKTEEAKCMYMSSFFFVYPVFAIAQCDIMGLCFVLLGLYYYMQKKNVKFFISFMLAITMKYFALFVFIPLILYRYRKIGKALVMLFGGVVLIGISYVLIRNSSNGAAALDNPDYYINYHVNTLGKATVTLNGETPVGLLGFFFMILCVIAYILPNKQDLQMKKNAVWLCLAGYMCFFLFYPCAIYWYVLLAPFMTLAVYNTAKYRKLVILLESIYGLAVGLEACYHLYWVLGGSKMFSYLFLRNFQCIDTAVYLRQIGFEQYRTILSGIGYASAVMFLILTFPREEKLAVSAQDDREIKNAMWIKVVILWFWIVLFVLNLIQTSL